MLEPLIIMGMVMAITEIIKAGIPENKRVAAKRIMPFIIILLGAGLNMLNAGIFGDGFILQNLKDAAKEGINFSALAAGIYGLGKSALGKS